MERQNTKTEKVFVSDDTYTHLLNMMVKGGDTEEEACERLKSWGVDTYPL